MCGPCRVLLVTADGDKELACNGNERLYDCLLRHAIPWSGVSLYKTLKGCDRPEPFVGLDIKLGTLPEGMTIWILFNRNIDPRVSDVTNFSVLDHPSELGNPVSEYMYRAGSASRDVLLAKLDTEECRKIVREQVEEFIKEHIPKGSKAIVGVSGGGDSNALLDALSSCRELLPALEPVIVTGVPIWNVGLPRAEELCERYDLSLRVVSEEELRNLAGIPDDNIPLFDRFKRFFPGDDFEFLGTLLIHLALQAVADARNAQFIFTGLNVEDLLAELLYSVANGLTAMTCPLRTIGRHSFAFPLWQTPKKIVDGCFPRWSLENYRSRSPGRAQGRSLFYAMALALESGFPGMAERLVSGSSGRSSADRGFHFDPVLGFTTLAGVPGELRDRFLEMLRAPLSKGRSNAI